MDGCRWALDKDALPKRVISIGARLGHDDGQTPNTLITLLDYEPVSIIFEVRGLPKNASFRQATWTRKANETMDFYCGLRTGTVVRCEEGYVRDGAAYDNQGELIRKFDRTRVSTKQNFIDAVRAHDGKMLQLDTDTERFTGPFSEAANRYVSTQLPTRRTQ